MQAQTRFKTQTTSENKIVSYQQRQSLSNPSKSKFQNFQQFLKWSEKKSINFNVQSTKISLLDYGAGNYQSIRNAIAKLGFQFQEVQQPEDILKAEVLVFPGVGAFGSAQKILKSKNFFEPLKQYLKDGKPFLGICIGMQLLFEASLEHGMYEGFNIIPGTIEQFQAKVEHPVPQMGWNTVDISQSKLSDPLLAPLRDSRFYYVHSFRALPNEQNKDWVSGTSEYGGQEYVAAVSKGDIYATQFHPEKSGEKGLLFINNFLQKYSQKQQNTQFNGSLLQSLEQKQQQVQNLDQQLTQQNSFHSNNQNKGISKRVIACLDVRNNDDGDLVVTKGDQYDVREQEQNSNSATQVLTKREVRNLGKPVELAERYYKEGADEITFLNITGFRDFPLQDQPMLDLLSQVSKTVYVPLTVGGGIRAFTDTKGNNYTALEVASKYFRSGADKVSIGSEAVLIAEEYYKSNKQKTGKTSIEEISRVYGNQALVISIDPRRVYNQDFNSTHILTKTSKLGPHGEQYCWWQCTIKGGREGRDIGAVEVAQAMEDLGAGEILLNCIDNDGQKQGFDIDLLNAVSNSVSIPVIASSGAGKPSHFVDAFRQTRASAALAAGIFHRKEVSIQDVKNHLYQQGIPTRL